MDVFKVYECGNKIRCGQLSVGGYVFSELNITYDCYISAGISNEESFSRDFTNRYSMTRNNSYGFDGTINDYPYHYTDNVTFTRKNIGGHCDNMHTDLSDLIDRYQNIFMKMDIEGGEYPWLLAMDEPGLDKFAQIVIEFHAIQNDEYGSKFVDKMVCFEKMNKTHYIVHAHGNNHAGITNGIPDVLEVTYVNKRFFPSFPKFNYTPLPIAGLDFPNHSAVQEINMNIYPFVSASVFLKLDVSIGEAIDKLSILEIKKRRINDPKKQAEIRKEIASLDSMRDFIAKYPIFYELLIYVNELIWDMTDNVKLLNITNPKFAESANNIFEYNQKRFRIKNWFNLLLESNINEQKSFAAKQCTIEIDSLDTFYDKIPELLYLALDHDLVYINSTFNTKIRTIMNIPTACYCNNSDIPIIHLSNFERLTSDIRCKFEPEPIRYLSGGLLGDFIHQLSIIKEIYMNTGRRGELFMANIGDLFRFGLENTYADIYDIIMLQPYIKTFHMITLETLSMTYKSSDFVMLSVWRNTPLLYKTNWYTIYSDIYKVAWGQHRWLDNLPVDEKFTDKIVINFSNVRGVRLSELADVYSKYGDSLIFVSFSRDDYDYYISIMGVTKQIPFYCPSSLYDMCSYINSAKMFIGGLSAPLAFAMSMHKPSIVLQPVPDQVGMPTFSLDYMHFIGLEKHLLFTQHASGLS